MMLALLLAQLVLPSAPSGPIQPPGMICLGACAGPVIYGAAEQRGRLVVACDMRSDACSDGRKITTTRTTPVPCETSPGVWEIVPADEGCYSVRGLESWAQNTSYLSWGAELDRGPWSLSANAAITRQGDVFQLSGTASTDFIQQLSSEVGGQVRTAACVVRAGTSNRASIMAANAGSGGSEVFYTLTSEWQTITATATIVEGGGLAGVRLLPAKAGAGYIEVAGCWSVIGTTPGRPCWGGEAPVTCAADRHTISTEGWPAESGEVSFVYRPAVVGDGASRFLVSASVFQQSGWEVYVRQGASLAFLSHSGGTARIYETPALTWEPRLYAIRVMWGGGWATFWRDGVQVGRVAMDLAPASPLPAMAYLGSRTPSGDSGYIDGSISNLRLRSTP